MGIEWGTKRVQVFPEVQPPGVMGCGIACGRTGVLYQNLGSGQGGKKEEEQIVLLQSRGDPWVDELPGILTEVVACSC